MQIIYVCNCCGARKINPETMSQISFENRTLHRCNYCTYKKIELKDFKAIFMFDEIIS
jgi:DNA-directed RNA polymerase subunit RPC12/RpoP